MNTQGAGKIQTEQEKQDRLLRESLLVTQSLNSSQGVFDVLSVFEAIMQMAGIEVPEKMDAATDRFGAQANSLKIAQENFEKFVKDLSAEQEKNPKFSENNIMEATSNLAKRLLLDDKQAGALTNKVKEEIKGKDVKEINFASIANAFSNQDWVTKLVSADGFTKKPNETGPINYLNPVPASAVSAHFKDKLDICRLNIDGSLTQLRDDMPAKEFKEELDANSTVYLLQTKGVDGKFSNVGYGVELKDGSFAVLTQGSIDLEALEKNNKGVFADMKKDIKHEPTPSVQPSLQPALAANNPSVGSPGFNIN